MENSIALAGDSQEAAGLGRAVQAEQARWGWKTQPARTDSVCEAFNQYPYFGEVTRSLAASLWPGSSVRRNL